VIVTGLTGLTAKQWLQLGAAVAVLAILVWAGLAIVHWKHEAAKVPGLKQEIATYEQQIKDYQADVASANKASAGFQAELERLRNARPVGPAPVVRVCRDATAVPAGGTAKPRPDEGASTGGVLPQEPGPDIGPALYSDADLADELSAQIRGLHEYIRGVCYAEKAGT
jgi:hypothetical protein